MLIIKIGRLGKWLIKTGKKWERGQLILLNHDTNFTNLQKYLT